MVINAKNSILALITLMMSLIKKKNTLDENALNRHATFCMF